MTLIDQSGAKLRKQSDAIRRHLRAAVGGSEATEHPPLEEVGCVEAWPCYQQREERPDGSEVCGGCGRVLRK